MIDSRYRWDKAFKHALADLLDDNICLEPAGMYILKAKSYEEAEELYKLEPLVVEGSASYKLKALRAAERENNYPL